MMVVTWYKRKRSVCNYTHSLTAGTGEERRDVSQACAGPSSLDIGAPKSGARVTGTAPQTSDDCSGPVFRATISDVVLA